MSKPKFTDSELIAIMKEAQQGIRTAEKFDPSVRLYLSRKRTVKYCRAYFRTMKMLKGYGSSLTNNK